MKVEKRGKIKVERKYWVHEVEKEGMWGVYMCGKEELRIGHWNTRWWDPGGGGSFIAKALLKTLRKLPPLQVSDFVRRIPSPLQTFTDSSSYCVSPTRLFTIRFTMYDTTGKATSSLLWSTSDRNLNEHLTKARARSYRTRLILPFSMQKLEIILPLTIWWFIWHVWPTVGVRARF